MKISAEKLGLVHKFVSPAKATRTPTLLLLHGTGGDENDLLPLGKMLLPEANLLSPRGAVLENGLPRFFRRFAEGVFDLEDLKIRTQQLAEFTEQASEAYGFDLTRVYAIGFSNGANIAASLLLLFPRLLAGAVLFRPMTPIRPVSRPDLSRVPVLILSGLQDTIVPREGPEKLAQKLEEAGANIVWRRQNAGHNLTGDEVVLASEWLKRVVGGEAVSEASL